VIVPASVTLAPDWVRSPDSWKSTRLSYVEPASTNGTPLPAGGVKGT